MTLKNSAVVTIAALALFAEIAVAQTEYDRQQTHFVRSTPTMQSPFPDDYDVIEPDKWRTIKLTIALSHGGRCDITLLRPLPWIDFTGAKVGGNVDLLIPEMGVAGEAKVIAIESCPQIEQTDKPGTRPVTGKFVTTNVKVIELSIEGLDEPIGTTAGHPLWSVDRGGWVPAGDLKPGEKLRTLDGTATVAGIKPRPGTETVYNLEVHKDHTYFVSAAKLWVHNACSWDDLARSLKYKRVKDYPFTSHGQPVYRKGSRYITPDVDQHRGGTWKMFDRKGNRLGTYNENLTARIGP